MNDEQAIDIDALMRDGAQIDAAMSEGVRRAAILHKQLGLPMVEWRDGQIVEIPPDEIVVPKPQNDRST